MKKLMLCIAAAAVLSTIVLFGQNPQNINASWQGTLKLPNAQLRIVIQISTENDKYKAVFYSIDQRSPAIPATTFTRDGSTIKMTIAAINGSYEGKLSADGNTITGTFTQGAPLPLDLVRATPDTAWSIPDPPPPPKIMEASADPSFEVSTIKPAKIGERFSLLLNQSGMLNTTATSLNDLMKFAYGVHPKQIVGGPSWTESDRYDVTGKPDTPGMPNVPQLSSMIRKLLKERFQLKFHQEKKELSVYAITVTPKGATITKADPSPLAVPGFAGGGQRGMTVRNSTIAEFGGILQANVLDRPVVDQTGFGITRYNFILKWTPDGQQLAAAGAPPNAPAVPDADAPPDIFTAFQQQLGLKLESTKAMVDVIVIDSVEKPSDN
jgi:bla regulator protein blaR1